MDTIPQALQQRRRQHPLRVIKGMLKLLLHNPKQNCQEEHEAAERTELRVSFPVAFALASLTQFFPWNWLTFSRSFFFGKDQNKLHPILHTTNPHPDRSL